MTRARFSASPAGDVRERTHVGFGGQRKAIAGVDAGRFEQFLAEGAPEFLDMSVQVHVTQSSSTLRASEYPLECSPDEPIAITTSPGRTRWVRDRVGLHDADGRRRQVVVRLVHEAGVGCLPAEQRAAGVDAAVGDALHDLGDGLGNHLADGDVVLQEQRFGTADDEIVDTHGDQVAADGVVHPIAWATASLVPTPSLAADSTGSR